MSKFIMSFCCYKQNHCSLPVRYQDMYILPTNSLAENGVLPITPAEFEKRVNELCSEARYVLENVWLHQCANIFLNLKQFWQEFAPQRPGDSTHTIELFFSCVNSLMASQLRRLVMRSLQHFLDLIVQYKVILFKQKSIIFNQTVYMYLLLHILL